MTKSMLMLLLGATWFCTTHAATEMDKFQSIQSGSTIHIAPGKYKLPPKGLRLEKLKDVTINAPGVTFVMSTYDFAFYFKYCENVTLRGCTIDYDPLPFTQGTVTAVNAEKRTIDISVHKGYPELDGRFNLQRMHLFAKDTHRWKVDAPDYGPKKVERLTASESRVYFAPDFPCFEKIEVGDRVSFDLRKSAAITLRDGCKGMKFEDVTVNSAPGLAVMVRFAEEAGTFKNFRIVPGPKPEGASEERLMASSADGMNIAYTRKGPNIDSCEYSYMGDDGVNLHGVVLPVLQWIDETSFLTMRSQDGEAFDEVIRNGDEIRFMREPSYSVLATGEVDVVRKTQESVAKWMPLARKLWPTFEESTTAGFYVIKLKKKVKGVEVGDFCDIPATSAPNFSIRNSVFHDHRARGLRLMSMNGVVEGNRFERIKGSAISLGPEYAFWREAGWTRNITVRGNTINRVGEGENLRRANSYTTGAISIMGRVMPQKEKTVYYLGNEDLVIEKNTIDGCSVSGISVVGAKKVRLVGNTIRNVNTSGIKNAGFDYGQKSDAPIVIIQAEVEQVGNNVE